MPPRPPDPKKLALALKLSREGGKTLAEIAEAIGMSSPTTAMNYINIAEQHERWFSASNRDQIRASALAWLAELQERGFRRLDEDDAVYEKVVPAMMAVYQELAKTVGLYAPIQVDGMALPPTPDPETTAQIRAALDELDAEERAAERAARRNRELE